MLAILLHSQFYLHNSLIMQSSMFQTLSVSVRLDCLNHFDERQLRLQYSPVINTVTICTFCWIPNLLKEFLSRLGWGLVIVSDLWALQFGLFLCCVGEWGCLRWLAVFVLGFFVWFNFSLSVVVSIMKVVCCVLLWGKEILANTHIIEFWCWNFRNIRESFYLGEGNLIFCCTGPNDRNFWQIKIVIILISHINISFLLFIFLLIWSFSFRLQ